MQNYKISVMMMFLILGVFSINTVDDAYACSCALITDKEALEKSFVSFVGTPIKIESPSGFNNIITFQIEKPIKNILENMTHIIIITNAQSSACGYNFKNSTRYLVHTYGEENQKTLETGLCSANKNLGFSNISLLVDESVLRIYPESVSWYQIDLYLMIAGIISSVTIGIIIYKRKIKLKTE